MRGDRDGVARRCARVLVVLVGMANLALAAGFLAQAPWAMSLWPWLADGYFADPTLSSYFLASIAAAIGVPVLWIGITGELGAAAGGAINLLLTFGGVGVFLFERHQQQGDGWTLRATLVCAVAALAVLAMLALARHFPIQDTRSMPLPVRLSFGLFAAVLVFVGVELLTDAQQIYPWWLNAETGTLYGWIYLGAATYFLYGLAFPRWHNACGQLLGFLAYDLVLLPPFLGRFATVDPARRLSLSVYTAVLVYSALLACYYLFLHGPTRLAWPATQRNFTIR